MNYCCTAFLHPCEQSQQQYRNLCADNDCADLRQQARLLTLKTMNAPYPISLILLAAGASRRMKASMDVDKMLLTLPDGKTLLQTSLEIYSAVPFQEILVILPERFRHSLALPDSARVLVNPNAESGMASSVVLGVESASPQARGYMIALGDMPLVRTASVEALCEAFLRKAAPTAICAPFFQEKRGNPVLFGNAYKQDLLHLSGDVGAKVLLKKYSDHVMEIAVNDEGIVRDIDSAEDWREFVVQH